MVTAIEIYRTVEAVLGDHQERLYKKFSSFSEMSTDELLELRGRVQATNEVIRQLRATLGYSPADL